MHVNISDYIQMLESVVIIHPGRLRRIFSRRHLRLRLEEDPVNEAAKLVGDALNFQLEAAWGRTWHSLRLLHDLFVMQD